MDRAGADAGESSPRGWWVALGVVLVAPWLDGDPRWPAWFGALVVALAAALGLAALRPELLAARPSRPLRALAVCALLLVGLAALQTLPLGGALGWLSPATVEARAPFLPVGSVGGGSTCLSLEPHLTRSGGLAWAGAAVVALLAARTGRPRALCAVLLAGAAAQALVALPQAGSHERAHAAFVSPNNLAVLLAMLLPVSLALAGVGQLVPLRGWRAGLPLAAGALLILGLVATRSRTGVLAAATGLLVHGALVGFGRGRRAALVAVAAATLVVAAGADAVLDRFGRLLEGEDTDRLAFWEIAWRLFLRFPLLGAGLRTHAVVTPELHTGPRLLDAAHNDYLNLLADCGLVGGALAAGAAAAWVVAARRGLAAVPPGGSRRGLLAATCGAVAAGAAASVVDFGLQIPAVLWTFAALAGVAAGGDPDARGARRSTLGPRRAWTRALGLGLGLAALALAFQGGRLALARLALDRARDPGAPSAEVRLELGRAARLWPEQGRIDLELARALRAAGELPGARQALDRAVRLSPRDPWIHLELAALGDDPAPARERARRLAPYDPAVRLQAGALALADGARAEGLADLRQALATDPGRLDAALALLVALRRVTVTDLEALLGDAAPPTRRRCVAAVAETSPAAARRLLEPLLGAGAERSDLARAAELDLQLGRVEAARAGWLAAARAEADAAPLLAVAARALERAGQAEVAGRLLEEAARPAGEAAVTAGEAAVWRELGRHHLRGRRWPEARAALERALALDPAVGGAELGEVFAAEGRTDSALLAWRRAAAATASARDRAGLHLRMARVLRGRGDLAAAAEAARTALSLDPGDAKARALVEQLR